MRSGKIHNIYKNKTMDIEDFIKNQVDKLNNGFSTEQIKSEIWSFMLSTFCGTARIEAIIFMSMDVYARIMNDKN